MEEFERLQTREFWIMEQEVRWTKRLKQSRGCDPTSVYRGYGKWSPRQNVQETQCGLEQFHMGFQGSRLDWLGVVYQQPLATGVQGWREPFVQRRKTEPFVSMANLLLGPRD
jgi:hypothetical protein